VKEKEYAKDVWQGYLNHLKAELGRSLSENEVKLAMQSYIHGVKVDVVLEEIKK